MGLGLHKYGDTSKVAPISRARGRSAHGAQDNGCQTGPDSPLHPFSLENKPTSDILEKIVLDSYADRPGHADIANVGAVTGKGGGKVILIRDIATPYLQSPFVIIRANAASHIEYRIITGAECRPRDTA